MSRVVLVPWIVAVPAALPPRLTQPARAAMSLSAQDVAGRPRSCQGTGFFGVDKNGHEISGCFGSLYESR